MNVDPELFDQLILRSCADMAIAVVIARRGLTPALRQAAKERAIEHANWTEFLIGRRGGVEVYDRV